MTRADSDCSGEIQSVPDERCDDAICCIEPPRRRITPTPMPVAAAAARTWRRVMPGRGAGQATAWPSIGARLTTQFNAAAPTVALAGCEEFVSAGRIRLTAVARLVPMSSVDAAWLGMEDPTNLMMVTGVLMLDGKVDPKRLRTLLDTRLAPFGRFHQRVVRPRSRARMPHWQ